MTIPAVLPSRRGAHPQSCCQPRHDPLPLPLGPGSPDPGPPPLRLDSETSPPSRRWPKRGLSNVGGNITMTRDWLLTHRSIQGAFLAASASSPSSRRARERGRQRAQRGRPLKKERLTTRSAHDGARARHAGTPRPDRRSRPGRGQVASAGLSAPLASRARRSWPRRRRSTPSARRRSATWCRRRGAPGR